MNGEGGEKVKALADDGALFEYVRTKKSRWSGRRFWILCSLALGLMWGLPVWALMVVLSGGRNLLSISAHTLAVSLLVAAIWGGLMYVWLARFVRRLTLNLASDKKFTAAEPVDLGGVIVRIPCNHQEGRVAIGGKLVVYGGGLCFIPHRWNWPFRRSVLKAAWTNVGRVYLSSGYFAMGRLYTGGFRDRLAVEVDGEDHFFVVDDVDRLVDDLNRVRAEATGGGATSV